MGQESEIVRHLEPIAPYVSAGLVAATGGAASYLYQYTKRRTAWSWIALGINMLLAGFAGSLVGLFTPPDFIYRDGLIAVAGFCAYPILGLVEAAAPALFSNLIKKLSQK